MDGDLPSLAELSISLRTTLRWSQAQLGDYVGFHQATVYRIEDGQVPPRSAARLIARLESLVLAGRALPGMSVADVVDLAIDRPATAGSSVSCQPILQSA